MLPPGLVPARRRASGRWRRTPARDPAPGITGTGRDQIETSTRGASSRTRRRPISSSGSRRHSSMLERGGSGRRLRAPRRASRAPRSAAVEAWGLEVVRASTRAEASGAADLGSSTPGGVDADEVRAHILDRFDMSLGTGTRGLQGQAVFRIGHLGDLNVLTLMGTLAGRGNGARPSASVPHRKGRGRSQAAIRRCSPMSRDRRHDMRSRRSL